MGKLSKSFKYVLWNNYNSQNISDADLLATSAINYFLNAYGVCTDDNYSYSFNNEVGVFCNSIARDIKSGSDDAEPDFEFSETAINVLDAVKDGIMETKKTKGLHLNSKEILRQAMNWHYFSKFYMPFNDMSEIEEFISQFKYKIDCELGKFICDEISKAYYNLFESEDGTSSNPKP